MNIVTRQYVATTGYHDLSPGQTPFALTEMTKETGEIISQPLSPVASQFNEIQVSGDPDLRRENLPEGDDGSSILFIDDEDYDAKFFLHQHLTSKNLPLGTDQALVRLWVALTKGNSKVLLNGSSTGIQFFDGGDWGGISDLGNKKSMLDHISGMHTSSKDNINANTDNSQWVTDFMSWRNGLTASIQFKDLSKDEGDEK